MDSQETKPAWWDGVRRSGLFFLIGLVLLIPKMLALRRRRKRWNALRLAALLIGIGILALGEGILPGWFGLIAGFVLIVLAVLLPPRTLTKTVDEQARELGALVVLNGGSLKEADGKGTPVQLFVAPDCIHVRDLQRRPVAVIPLTQMASVQAEEGAGGWRLLVAWNQGAAAFHFDGFFAEHLARVAEATLRSQLRRELPVLGN